MLVPSDFQIPSLRKPAYTARKLTAADVKLDYDAVMSSIDIIHETRGSVWPIADLTLEQDIADLKWHEQEFENKTSFAFTVMNKDESKCLGCIYFYPPGEGMSDISTADGYDVEVSWWVTTEAYPEGFYDVLGNDLRQWVSESWPFQNVYWANKVLPWEN